MTDGKKIDDTKLDEIAGGTMGLGNRDLVDDPPTGDDPSVGKSSPPGGGSGSGSSGPGDSTGGTGDGANQDLG